MESGSTTIAGKLHYFPAALPGEIIYSVIARYFRHIGLPLSDRAGLHMFEVERRRRNIDFSSRLGLLASKLPDGYHLDAAALLRNHTTFPYYAHFMDGGRREAAVSARVDLDSSSSFSSSGWKWLHTDKQLRFCPKCLPPMRSAHGEFYWRRDHQIPSVLVCPDHGCVLLIANLSGFAKRQYCPATEITCRPDAQPVVTDLTAAESRTLHEIAARSAELLNDEAAIVAKAVDAERYRDSMRAKGLLEGKVHTRTEALKKHFLALFGHLRRIWPQIFEKTGVRGSGAIDRIAGASAEVTDPLMHILLDIMLTKLPDVVPTFGPGPWPCPNKLARHDRELPVTTILRYVTPVGRARFTCPCGYSFVRTVLKDGQWSNPTIREFGPTLRPLLDQAASEGWPLTRTAVAAGISDVTLHAIAKSMGYADLWPNFRLRSRQGQ